MVSLRFQQSDTATKKQSNTAQIVYKNIYVETFA